MAKKLNAPSPMGRGQNAKGTRRGNGGDCFAARRRRNKVQPPCLPGICSWENTLLRGNRATIPQKSGHIPPASPSQKSLDFCEMAHDGSALRVSQSCAPEGGEIKSNPVFSGDMRLGKHSAHGKWGDNSEGIEPHFPCIPHKSPWTFVKRSALL